MTAGRILVTGATGMVGGALVSRLLEEDRAVTLALRRETSREAWPSGDLRFVVTGNLEEAADLSDAMRDVAAVVHLAGHAHVSERPGRTDTSPAMRANLDGTAALVDAAKAIGPARFVHMSSVAAVAANAGRVTVTDDMEPDPPTLYGRSKLFAERKVQELAATGTLAVSLRPPLIVGAKAKGNLAALARLAKMPFPLPFRALRNRRSLLSLATLCNAILHLLDGDFPVELSGAYAIADWDPLSLAEIVTALRAGMGREPGLIALPPVLFDLAGRAPGQRQRVGALTGDLVVDPSRFEAVFGFLPPGSARSALEEMGYRRIGK